MGTFVSVFILIIGVAYFFNIIAEYWAKWGILIIAFLLSRFATLNFSYDGDYVSILFLLVIILFGVIFVIRCIDSMSKDIEEPCDNYNRNQT